MDLRQRLLCLLDGMDDGMDVDEKHENELT